MDKQQIIGLILLVLGMIFVSNAIFAKVAIGNLPSAIEGAGDKIVEENLSNILKCDNISQMVKEKTQESGFVARTMILLFESDISKKADEIKGICDKFVENAEAAPANIKNAVEAEVDKAQGNLSALILAGLLLLIVGFALLWRKPSSDYAAHPPA